jgi:methionyl aminopeptidase
MTIENEQDLAGLREIGRIVGTILKQMMQRTEPGMTTAELDQIGKELLDYYEAVSAPNSVYGFPGYTCISINEEAAHGIPGERVIQAGDMVNIDVSAQKKGYFGDTGASFVVPPASALQKRLLHATRQTLANACSVATAGAGINAIGKAIQTTAKAKGFKTLRNLCSHGVGRSLHEYPEEIPPYFDARDKRQLHEGLVITIEPFLSTRANSVYERDDGWTLAAPAGNLCAQFEHTMVITRGKPELLTLV